MTKPDLFEPVEWKDGRFRFLDQTLLPGRIRIVETDAADDVVEAIRRLAIRGAPLIGIAAAYAVVLAASASAGDRRSFEAMCERIRSARPTAVNLATAVGRMLDAMSHGNVRQGTIDVLIAEAARIHQEEKDACRRIASTGQEWFGDTTNVLTICNTGLLATGGIGTAFGIIRQAWEAGRIGTVFVCETRPLLQGARLTMWECGRLGIPAVLIHDSAAGAVMQTREVGLVVTGADRIARNGDTANKIGTYPLAVLASRHGVPFVVAAPVSTIDMQCPDGASIPVEVRSPDEVTSFAGSPVSTEGATAYAPAFDVTPSELIDAIVTDRGVVRTPFEEALPVVAGGTS